jgi:hypothetical protein
MGTHWSQLKGNALVFHPFAALLGPFPPCGGRSGWGENGGRIPLLTPSFILPRQGGGEKKTPTCGLSRDR